jgi:uncharacterized membrane protein
LLRLEDYKILFIIASLTGTLLFASPSLELVIHLPGEEAFSELWVLGSNRTTEDYPFNVKTGEVYKIFIGVANHMGSSSYYIIKAKFRNQTDPLPDSSVGAPSSLPELYKYYVVLQNGEEWETQLTFSFSNISKVENRCNVGILKINDVRLIIDKPAIWNINYTGYYYQLFFELWIFNAEIEDFQFHNRFVGIWLNVTF